MTYALWGTIVTLVWLLCIAIAFAHHYRGRMRQLETAVSRPAPVDHTAMLVEALAGGMSKTAEAIGKAVQTAQFAPADPPPKPTPTEGFMDADIEAGIVDTSDPTDGAGWLARERVEAVRLTNGDSPFGIPGLTPRRNP